MNNENIKKTSIFDIIRIFEEKASPLQSGQTLKLQPVLAENMTAKLDEEPSEEKGKIVIHRGSSEKEETNQIATKEKSKIKIGISFMNSELKARWKEGEKFVVGEYERIVEELVNNINFLSSEYCRTNNANCDEVKLRMLFNYLSSDENHFDYSGITPGGTVSQIPYVIPQYENMNFGIAPYSKYAPIISHIGVCISYSRAFKDICDRLNIPCMIVNGNTGMQHSWNAVRINGEVRYVDIAFAIMNRKWKNNYFLKNGSDVSRYWGNRTIYQESIDDITRFCNGERVEETCLQKNDIVISRFGYNEEERKIKKYK